MSVPLLYGHTYAKEIGREKYILPEALDSGKTRIALQHHKISTHKRFKQIVKKGVT